MRKKLFVFLMAFFMVAALCCGCASNANNLEDNKSQTIVDVDQNKDETTSLEEDQTNVEENEDDDQLQGMASGSWNDYKVTATLSNGVSYVSQPGQLAYIANQMNTHGGSSWTKATIYLSADLDLSAHYWNYRIGTGDGVFNDHSFQGTFNGRGHTIYGMRVDGYLDVSLFGNTNGATISHLNVVGTYNLKNDFWNGDRPFGGIVSSAKNTTITNCTFDGTVTTASDYTNSVGGIVGYMDGGNIDSCINYAKMSIGKASSVGGIVGNLVKGDIDNSVNLCNFTSLSAWTGALGGIVGYSDQGGGKVTDSANYATISTSYTGNNVGGIVGKFVNNYRIDRCINYGNVTASNSKNVGGIIGSLGGEYTEWFQTKYRGTNALTNCISYGLVSGRETAGAIGGLIYCNVVRGCIGRHKNINATIGSWAQAPSDANSWTYTGWYESLESYQTENYLKNHSNDFNGTLNGFSCGSWSGAYSSWWKYNSAIYDFLDGRYNTGDSTTISNIKYGSHYTCAVPNGITGQFGIFVYYKKSGVSAGYFDASDKYVEISSRTSSGNYSYLYVDYLYSAPYSKGYSWSMNIFTISNSSNFTLDTSDYYYSKASNSSYKCYSISPEKYNSTCAAVRFASCDGAYRAPNEYLGAGYINLKFTAKAKNVTFSSNVSGCTIKDNGTAITSKNYYYRDNFSGISVTPRLGYYLSEVKDNYHSYTLYTGTTLGTISIPTKSDWYRYSLTKVTCTFKPISYTISVKYNGTTVSTSSDVVWSTNGVKIDIKNDDFSDKGLPFGYKYSYASGFVLGNVSFSDSFRFDMTGTQNGSVSSNVFRIEANTGYKLINTWVNDFLLPLNSQVTSSRIPDIHIDPFDPGTGGESQHETLLKAKTMTLYLTKASPIQYTLDMFKGFKDEDSGNIPGKTGVSIKVNNSSGTLLKNYPESSSDGTTDSITFNTDSKYKITIGAYRGYQILGYRIHITPKTDSIPVKYESAEKDKGISYEGSSGGHVYYNVEDLKSIYTLQSQIIQQNGEDLFIKNYLTNAFKYMKNNSLLGFDFSEENLAEYYNFYIKVVYKPLTYSLNVKVNGEEQTFTIDGQSDLSSAVAWKQFKNSGNNVKVKISSKNYLVDTKMTSVYHYDSVTITAAETDGSKRFLGIYLGDNLLTTKNVYTFIVDPNKFGSDSNMISGLNLNVKYSNEFATTITTKTEAHIYEISSVDDLKWLSEQVAKGTSFAGYIFNQTQDIDMSGVKFKPIGDGAKSTNGSEIHVFMGVYNGNGYRIKNLKFDDENLSYVGLFGNVSGATIKNLTIDSGSFTGYNYVGIFAGKATSSKFENVHNVNCNLTTTKISYVDIYGISLTQQTIDYTIASDVVEHQTLNGSGSGQRWWADDLESHSNDVYDLARNSTGHGIGGIVGFAQNCQFLAVSMKANVKNNDSGISGVVGAMIGHGSGNTIDQCYAKGTFSGVSSTTQLYGGSATVTNSYITNGSTVTYSQDAEDTETRRNASDIWMELNGEWVLRIFYW